jgi:hypothetical protein
MLKSLVVVVVVCFPSVLSAQAASDPRAPDECFGFRFGSWDPPLKSVASRYNPGYDPTTSAPAGAPRDWAAHVPSGAPETMADSVLMLFPAWWPAGVTIAWTERRGDTLVGRATALVADGRLKNPVTTVRGGRFPCAHPATAPRDTAGPHGS